MNQREENKINMYRTVQDVLSKHSQDVETIPVFAQSAGEFSEQLILINDLDNQYQSATKGATANKHMAEDELVNRILQISGPASVYAKHSGNMALRELTLHPDSFYRYTLRDNELHNRGKLVLNTVSQHTEALAPYGITQESVDALRTAVEVYGAAIGGKGGKNASAVAARSGLSQAISEADDILKDEIDAFMEAYKVTHPEFARKYGAARVIVDN